MHGTHLPPASSPGTEAVLVVEDNDMYRTVVTAILHQRLQEFDIIGAASVKDALGILRSRRVDVMVVDMNLPDGTALTLLDQIQDKVSTGLKTIVFSNHAHEEMEPLMSRRDIHVYVEKAQGPMHLADCIENLRRTFPPSNVASMTSKAAIS